MHIVVVLGNKTHSTNISLSHTCQMGQKKALVNGKQQDIFFTQLNNNNNNEERVLILIKIPLKNKNKQKLLSRTTDNVTKHFFFINTLI